ARDVHLVLVNGRLSVRSFARWRKRPATSLALFGRLGQVLAQSDRHAARFRELGAPAVVTTGNLKIDAPLLPVDAKAHGELEPALRGRPVFVAASTHDGEEDMVAEAHEAVRDKLTRLLTIVAPRHPERGGRIASRLRARGIEVAQRSRGEKITPSTGIYLADTIGELGLFYALSPLAFIGGSLVPHGGQNPVEAMRHDCVVMTGPYVQNFEDTYEALYDGDACVEVGSASELAAEAVRLLSDKDRASAMLRAGKTALQRMEGALERSIRALMPALPAAAAKVPERAK
ncbi:MAG: 3-deoxy-D-manno-octulosonic acid transferase, partial [Hyphomicrobiales bacterium]